jgi:ComF family protein
LPGIKNPASVGNLSENVINSSSRQKTHDKILAIMPCLTGNAKGANRGGAEMKGEKSWRTVCLDLIFPPRCLLCAKFLKIGDVGGLCPGCQKDIYYLQPPFCVCCGEKVAGDQNRRYLCGACLSHPPPFLKARAVIDYDQPISGLLHRLKYSGDTTVLPGFEHIIKNAHNLMIPPSDLIVPVPLSPKRLKGRGLNQSILLARLFYPERLCDIRADILKRMRDTPAQASLSGSARRKNLRGAFAVGDKGAIRGKSLCIVDDVYTTGATVSECSKTLLAHGAHEVQVLTLARVATAMPKV